MASQDGKNWIQQPDTEGTGPYRCTNPQEIVMSSDVYIGLAVTSHDSKKTATRRGSQPGIASLHDVSVLGLPVNFPDEDRTCSQREIVAPVMKPRCDHRHTL